MQKKKVYPRREANMHVGIGGPAVFHPKEPRGINIESRLHFSSGSFRILRSSEQALLKDPIRVNCANGTHPARTSLGTQHSARPGHEGFPREGYKWAGLIVWKSLCCNVHQEMLLLVGREGRGEGKYCEAGQKQMHISTNYRGACWWEFINLLMAGISKKRKSFSKEM